MSKTRGFFDTDFDDDLFPQSDGDDLGSLLIGETLEETDRKYFDEKNAQNQVLLAEKEANKTDDFSLALANLCEQLIQLASKHVKDPSHPVWKELLKKLFDEETSAIALATIEKTTNVPVKRKVFELLNNYHQKLSAAVKTYSDDPIHNTGIAYLLQNALKLPASPSLTSYQASIQQTFYKLNSLL